MKKIISQSTVFSLGIALFLSLAVFPGCKKEAGNNQNPPTPTPTLTASAEPESVDYNGTSKVTYSSKNLDSLTMNSEKFPLSGDFMLNDMKKDTSFIFVGYYDKVNTDGGKAGVTVKTITKTVAIAVGDSVPPVLPTISLKTNSGDTIPWNTIGGITGKVENADSTLTDVPDFPMFKGNGTFGINTPFLTSTTTYHFWVYREGKMMVEDSIRIIVGEYPYSERMDLLTIANGWSSDSMWDKIYEEDEWDYYPTSPEYKSFWTIFYVNGRIEEYKPPHILTANGVWSFSEDETIITFGDDWHIIILNDSTLKVWAKIPCLGCEVDSVFSMEKYKVHQ